MHQVVDFVNGASRTGGNNLLRLAPVLAVLLRVVLLLGCS